MVSESAQVAITTVFTVLVITDIVGNTLVCAVVIKSQEMRTPMNYLLVNLALADIMVALFIAPQFILIHTFKHPDGMTGSLFCKLLTGGSLTWIGTAASAFTLVVIAFERYYAVLYPYGNKGKMTNNKLKVLVPAIWISTAILNTPIVLTSYFSKEDNYCMEHWPEEWMAKAYSLTWVVFLGVLPVVIMTVLYSRVVYSLWIKEERSTSTQKGVISASRRVTKMVVAVSVIYGLCWIPGLVIYTLINFSSEHNLGDLADIISIVLVTFNSTVNPVIYAYANGRFRKCFKELLCCKGEHKNRVCDVRRKKTAVTNTAPTAATVHGEAQDINSLGFTLHNISSHR